MRFESTISWSTRPRELSTEPSAKVLISRGCTRTIVPRPLPLLVIVKKAPSLSKLGLGFELEGKQPTEPSGASVAAIVIELPEYMSCIFKASVAYSNRQTPNIHVGLCIPESRHRDLRSHKSRAESANLIR
ncbi:hypothetical protein G7Y89_g6894 [Cudoniella acicularis]|uniref:Uncharacterized protein n=1 Tax=Cudoniella acicularis TaxID=354080 RepID=A0A8H4RN18_9HELO|nr:hypothetical protein G7Y89_g6894 [Cudoniella acicularis]